MEAWQCELAAAEELPETLTHLGYRSHQIVLQSDAGEINSFPCWLVSLSETPHEMTLYLRLHAEPKAGEAAHLQADVSKDIWRTLSARPQPWQIKLDPDRLLLLEE